MAGKGKSGGLPLCIGLAGALGDICDFPFAFLYTNSLLKRGSQRDQILSV